MERDKLYVQQILDAIQTIAHHMKGIEYENFFESKLVQDAVIRELEIIGEASKRLSNEFKQRYADIPWKEISGMRDKLIHDYLDVDLVAVWETVEGDLPDLKDKLSFIDNSK